MSNDPASLDASISLEGLDAFELVIVLGALPIGKSIVVNKVDGIIGMPRHEVFVNELSIGQARTMLDTVVKAMEDRTAEYERQTIQEGKAP